MVPQTILWFFLIRLVQEQGLIALEWSRPNAVPIYLLLLISAQKRVDAPGTQQAERIYLMEQG